MFRFAPLALFAAACGLPASIRGSGMEVLANAVTAPPIASRPVRRARPSFSNSYRRADLEWQREKPGGKAALRRQPQRSQPMLASLFSTPATSALSFAGIIFGIAALVLIAHETQP